VNVYSAALCLEPSEPKKHVLFTFLSVETIILTILEPFEQHVAMAEASKVFEFFFYVVMY